MMKYLIVGLGNIGAEYADTRHNIGFQALQYLADSKQAVWTLKRHAFQTEIKEKNRTLILIQPTTYMNLSGKAVKYWLDSEHIPIENLLVITDDIDLPFGSLRLLGKGGGGSHNGMNHIIETLEHQNFARLRFGIGKNYEKGRQSDYVLGEFNDAEMQALPERLEKVAQIVKSFALQGIGKTMNLFNSERFALE